MRTSRKENDHIFARRRRERRGREEKSEREEKRTKKGKRGKRAGGGKRAIIRNEEEAGRKAHYALWRTRRKEEQKRYIIMCTCVQKTVGYLVVWLVDWLVG